MSANSSRYVKILINGKQLANVIGAETLLEREPTVEGTTLSVNSKLLKAKIKRQIFLKDSRKDGINLRALSKFSLTISYPGVDSSFADCEWIDFKETIAEDGTVTEEMTVASTKYSMST